MVWEKMSFEEFEDGRHVMPPIKFQLNRTSFWEMLFEEFQDGHRVAILGIRKERF